MDTTPDLELISFKTCPFVQRSIITLRYKDVPHRVTHIDPADPPAWFEDLSPTGQVPLLRVNGEDVLFESAVINEYIDETTAPPLHPADPLRRAMNRAWIEFGAGCLPMTADIFMAENEKAFEHACTALAVKLDRVEEVFGDGPWFNGGAFSLVDAAWAPFFMRLRLLNRTGRVVDADDYPKMMAWSDALLALPAVRESVVEEFPELYDGMLRMRGSDFARGVLLPE